MMQKGVFHIMKHALLHHNMPYIETHHLFHDIIPMPFLLYKVSYFAQHKDSIMPVR